MSLKSVRSIWVLSASLCVHLRFIFRNLMPLEPSSESLAAPVPPDVRKFGHFDNRELSTIAVLAAIHFAVSFAARLFGYVLYGLLGPMAVYFGGLGDEGIPSLLLAVAIVLVPRFGTASLSIATVWLLNVLVTGTLSFVSLLMVSTSLVMYEIVLGVAGVTLESRLVAPMSRPRPGLVLRTALALGTANALALYIQFFVSMTFYKLAFEPWYYHSVALVTGLGYGAVGAAIGTIWGYQLRKAAP
jgi:hypothetical protein